ncbi:MAG: hypothetical protein ABL962_03000 [Fimbriimonadaceae bacterium]
MRGILLASLFLFGCADRKTSDVSLEKLPHKASMGAVMNIDLAIEDRWKRNFQGAEGWASYVRISIGIESEGWDPDPSQCRFDRLHRLAKACRAKGYGMVVTLGGLPTRTSASAWSKLGMVFNYQGKRYREMPDSWHRAYVKWHQRAIRELLQAYGPNAKQKVRFICLNEPYGRGEDGVVDKLIDVLLKGLLAKDGKVRGCEIDFPTIWGSDAQLKGQLEWLAGRTQLYPKTFGRLKRIPLNIYLPEIAARNSKEAMIQALSNHAKQSVASSRSILKGHEPYFGEFGVSRAWDTPSEKWGSDSARVASDVLLGALEEVRSYVSAISIYQAAEPTEDDELNSGFGLINMAGAPTVDLGRLRKLSR